jgi:hypothetical protein
MAGQGRVRLGVVRAGARPAAVLAARSQGALDRPLGAGADGVEAAELWVAVANDSALLVGAYQRASGMARDLPLYRRGSGGPEVLVGPGTVHVALSLPRPDALEPCGANRIVNRAVRPLLRALTRTAKLAHYFGRDWVSVMHRPAAWVGFAHDAASRRTLFEAFVAVRTPFATWQRPSLLDKPLGTLEAISGRSLDPQVIADAIVDAYLAKHGAEEIGLEATGAAAPPLDSLPADPAWTAQVEEAIGRLGAGVDAQDTFRIGGELLVSRDVLARLEARVAVAPDGDIGRIVDEELTAPGVAIEGIASFASFREVILEARRLRGS